MSWEEIVERCDAYNERLKKFVENENAYLTDYYVLDSVVDNLIDIWKTDHSADIIQKLDIASAHFKDHKNYIYLNLAEYYKFRIICSRYKIYQDTDKKVRIEED